MAEGKPGSVIILVSTLLLIGELSTFVGSASGSGAAQAPPGSEAALLLVVQGYGPDVLYSDVVMTDAGPVAAIAYGVSEKVDLWSYQSGSWHKITTLDNIGGVVTATGVQGPGDCGACFQVAHLTGTGVDILVPVIFAGNVGIAVVATTATSSHLVPFRQQNQQETNFVPDATLRGDTIISGTNDCIPDCAEGTITTTTWRYDPSAMAFDSVTGSPPTTTTPAPSPSFTVSPDEAPLQVVFVHGIRSGCDEPGTKSYVALFQELVSAGRGVYSFCYDHDIAFAAHPDWSQRCFSDSSRGESQAIDLQVQPDTSVAPLAIDGPVGEAKDDGDGPLAYDAAKLDDCLNALRAYDIRTHGGSEAIALIGNSMGGAIVRGWVQLAQARQSQALQDGVTTVMFLEGAIEGSWIARIGSGVDQGLDEPWNPVSESLDLIARKLASLADLDPSRPGVKDLVPGSDYYRSIAEGPPPPQLHYFTYSTDIVLHYKVGIGPWKADVGTTDFLGDGIMQLGDPSPSAEPPWGGSEFDPGGDRGDQHQFVVTRNYDVVDFEPVSPVQAVLTDPYGHFSFGDHIGEDTMQSCQQGLGTQPIVVELHRILSHPATACSP